MANENSFRYPLNSSFTATASEQPMWLKFVAATYSLKKKERTREGINARPEFEIYLPLPKDPGYTIAHDFGISNDNPIAPLISIANIANSSNSGQVDETSISNLMVRMAQPSTAYYERLFATSTYRRFSNLTEMTMVSEGRKQYFFQYIFTPKNSEEAVQVEAICGTFRKSSYPTLASNLPERTFPQGLWTIEAIPGINQPDFSQASASFLGEPLPCVLKTVIVKKNDEADPVTRFLPNGASAVTLLGLVFQEFETGTYDPNLNQIRSKSEIATDYL
jgi:hypothetical protein